MLFYGFWIGITGFILHTYLKCKNCDTSEMLRVIFNILSKNDLLKTQFSNFHLCLEDNC